MLWISVSTYVLCSQKDKRKQVLLSQRRVAITTRLNEIKEMQVIQQSIEEEADKLHREFEFPNPCCNVCCQTVGQFIPITEYLPEQICLSFQQWH